jgi:hypothetical protein
MNRLRKTIVLLLIMMTSWGQGQDAVLQKSLENVYVFWRNAMIKKDFPAWQKVTAAHRQQTVKNRLNSERRVFPKAIFEVPTSPPALKGLQAVQVKRNGRTAKCIYYGKIDFGVGGDPTDNLLVVDFVQEASGWKYDVAEFVSLGALPDVRAELAKGDLSFIEKTKDFSPVGVVPPVPMAIPIAKYIAKVYVFCPGRAVDVTVNKISEHSFGNAKDAQLIMGGVRDGANEVSYSVKGVPGGKGNEALAIRVYVFSQVDGVKPIKAFEYQVLEGGVVQAAGKKTFTFDAAMVNQLMGK